MRDYKYLLVGWWHPDVVRGRVHDHDGKTLRTYHRLCEPVYTKRPVA